MNEQLKREHGTALANAQNVAANAAMNASAELEAQQTKAAQKLAVHEAEHQKIQTKSKSIGDYHTLLRTRTNG